MTGVENLIARFFSHIDLDVSIPNNRSPKDWERFLLDAQNEPFYMNMQVDFPYFIQVSMMYSGSSKVKGGEWLSFMDRRAVVLKERKFLIVHLFPTIRN